MGCVGRSCSSRQPWRLARRERDEQWLKLGVELPIQPPSIPLSSVLVPHGRLPRLSAAFSRTSEDARGSKCSAGVVYSAGRDAAGPVGASDAVSTPLRVCYLGGSVTEQKAGWRPRLTQWIRAQLAGGPPGQVDRSVYSLDKDESTTDGRVEEIRAWCGNSGSKVLAFLTHEWVVKPAPDLLFIELAINDGDTLLETDDEQSIGCALEGIVRQVKEKLPHCEICFLLMYVRGDLPLTLRTGSAAWAHNTDNTAADAYHVYIPALHTRIGAHYGAPIINLIPLMSRLSSAQCVRAFRDDCHLNEEGAILVAAVIAQCLRELTANLPIAHLASSPLPRPLHLNHWSRGSTRDVDPRELSFFYIHASPPPHELASIQSQIISRHTQLDVDPLKYSAQRAWWLLYPGETAQVSFRGSRLAILTMIGPDAGKLVCEVTTASGGRRRTSQSLLDRWAYFWRVAVVMVAEGLPSGVEHVARLSLEREKPDPGVLKRLPTGQHWEQCVAESKDHKLWLMYWLVGE